MQLAILSAILAAIAAAESGGGPVDGLPWRLAATFIAVWAAPLAAFVAVQRLARSATKEEQTAAAAARLETALMAAWLSAVAFMLLVGQWPRIVRANWQLAQWPLIDEVAILLPVLAPLLLIWAAMHRLERSDTSPESPANSLGAYLLLQARHHLALVLLPPLFVVGLIESVATLKIAQLDAIWWFAIPQFVIVLALMPLAVRRIWQTTPLLLEPLRGTLDQVCRSRTTKVREILLWQTNGTMANAAVVGVSPFLRYLLLTDVLIAQLTDAQIAAVVRHELAHLRRWHLPLRLALLLLPVVWCLAVKNSFPECESLLGQALATLGVSANQLASVAMPLLLLAYAVVVVGWYSRMLEHDADVDACLDDRGQFDICTAADFCSALVTVCGGAQESWFSRWLHPAVHSRVGLLAQFCRQPEMHLALRQKTSRVAKAIGLLYITAAGLMIFGR